VLQVEIRPRPDPGPREILLRVEAAGVNRPDVHQRQGNYPPPPGVTDVLGLEIAGEVVALGLDAGIHRLGARVAALVPGGG
jgi:NADPH:quinone reductase-like Zn-dependent oxidoreductase